MVTFSITTTLVAAAATVGVDTGHAATTNWSYATGSAIIPSTAPAADWIVIEFSLGATIGLWVCATGALDRTTVAAGQASCIFLPPGESQPFTISNLQPMANWNIASGAIAGYSGPSKDGSQSEAWGLTTQSGYTGTHSGTHWPSGPNFLALIPTASATGPVTITFQ